LTDLWDVEEQSIDWDEPSICPDCACERFRTIQDFRAKNEQSAEKWYWVRGCQNCPFDEVIGKVK
jgi:hypothetical protein